MKLTEISGAPEGFPPCWWVLKVEGVEKPVLLHQNWLNELTRMGFPSLQVGDEVEFQIYPAKSAPYRDLEDRFTFVKNFKVKEE